MLILNEADHEVYESCRKYWLNKHAHRDGGYAEAHAEGYAEGFVLGLAMGPIQLLEELLGRAITPIERLETRSLEELHRIGAELNADWYAKEANRS